MKSTHRYLHALGALICLLAVGLLCFGPRIGQIGFYLDDWSMFSQLHFCAQDWLSLTKQCLSDVRVQIRPLEAPYFALLQLFFQDHPLGAHVCNLLLEVLGAWFLYLSMVRMTGDKALSMVAGLLFLLYPNHDATHYWITASSSTLSMTLYLASLWLSIKGVQNKRAIWLYLAALTFAASVYNYEAYMPLVALSGGCILLLLLKQYRLRQAIYRTGLYLLPYLGIVVSMYLYQRVYIASLKMNYTRPMVMDPAYMASVLEHGFRVSLGPDAFAFFAKHAQEVNHLGNLTTNIIALVAICLLAIITLAVSKAEATAPRKYLLLMVLGLVTLISSYSIFALAADYLPILDTIINRVNYGGALGASLFIAGALGLLANLLGRRSRLYAVVLSALCIPLVVFFTLTNWALSKPWTLSWTMQKQIRQILAGKAQQFHDGDCILLANAPRYVNWSPMFDGVWDFEQMVRLTLNNKKINGNVVSERFSVLPNELKDISLKFVCARYPYRQLFLLVPCPEQWFEIHSAQQFISTVEQHGMHFGLDPKAVSRWKQESSTQAKLK
jgi:hypothetical protein